MRKTVITSYYESDLDAISSMYAYSEYLNKKEIESNYYVYGKPKKEVEIVCDLFNINLQGRKTIDDTDEIIIVDTNNPQELTFVNSENVIEIIDHHKKSATNDIYKRAKIQIEQIGAVATIIAEKFRADKIPISPSSAILLYYGIISNTINLMANITSSRDKEMIEWLETQCDKIDKEKIKVIFERKSQIEDYNLRREMEAEVTFNYKGKLMIVAQLEVANVEDFLEKKKAKIIEVLKQVKTEKEVDYIFINCVDILNGFNIVLTIDDKTQEILEDLFGYNFQNGIYKNNKLVQRKELLKVLKS